MLTTCATDYVTWRNELAGRRRAGQRRRRSAASRSSTSAIPLVFGRRLGSRLRAAALARRRARLARRRRTDQPRAHRLHREARRPTTTTACSSAIATTTLTHGARAAADRAILVPTAERDAAIGLSIFRADLPRRARAHVQLARGTGDDSGRRRQRGGARRRRRHRLGRAVAAAAGALPAEVQHPRAVCGLRRADRPEQGLQGAVRVLPGAICAMPRAAVAGADRQLAAADSRAPAHPPSRLPRRCRQVRRHGRAPSC